MSLSSAKAQRGVGFEALRASPRGKLTFGDVFQGSGVLQEDTGPSATFTSPEARGASPIGRSLMCPILHDHAEGQEATGLAGGWIGEEGRPVLTSEVIPRVRASLPARVRTGDSMATEASRRASRGVPEQASEDQVGDANEVGNLIHPPPFLITYPCKDHCRGACRAKGS